MHRLTALASVLVLGASATAAFADTDSPLDAYPLELVNRPLLLPGGVWSASASFGFTSVPGLQFGKTSLTGFGASHSFGAIEPFVGVTFVASQPEGAGLRQPYNLDAGVKVAITEHTDVELTVTSAEPTKTTETSDVETAFVAKLPLVPDVIAVSATAGLAGVYAPFDVVMPDGFSTAHDYQLGAFATVEGELQVAPPAAVFASLHGIAPLYASNTGTLSARADVDAGALYALGHEFDFMVDARLVDATRAVNPTITAGATGRF